MPTAVRSLLIVAVFHTLGIIFVLTEPVNAQTTATGASKLTWDIQGPTLTEVQTYTWKYYPDSATAGIALTGVTCSAPVGSPAGVYTCSTPFPAFTPGAPHTIVVAASNTAGEANKSDPLSFTFVLVPAKATNLRAQ